MTVVAVPVTAGLPGAEALSPGAADGADAADEPLDVEAPERPGRCDTGESDEAEVVGDLDPEPPGSAPAAPAPPKITATSPTAAPTSTAMSRAGVKASAIILVALAGFSLELAPLSASDALSWTCPEGSDPDRLIVQFAFTSALAPTCAT